MNKTVNINIGGLFFHIDEEAYQNLNTYFESIKKSLSNSSGQEEIMNDIEMRVAELFTEKQKSDKHVINSKDVDDIVTIMGQPEDYTIDQNESKSESKINYNTAKKLYRDKEKGIIGGVCTGLGHYFGVDALLIKVIFIILFFTSIGLVAYIILWIAVPPAITTAEKIEMTGEPVTISNIEKKIREEFNSIDFDNIKNKTKSGAQKIKYGLVEIIENVLKVFAKILGVFILFISAITLVGLFLSLFAFGTVTIIEAPWHHYINAFNYSDIPLWMFSVLLFFAIGIPVFFLLLLGIKLLFQKFKSIGNTVKYGLLGVWIIVIITLLFIGIKQSTERAYNGKYMTKESIPLNPNDTLSIKFINNDSFSNNINETENLVFTQDNNKNEVIYSNNIRFEIKFLDNTSPYLQVEKIAKGKSFEDANQRAEKINYNFNLVDNKLILDNYFLTDVKNKYRNQKIHLYLYLPNDTYFKVHNSVELFDKSNTSFFNPNNYSNENIYKVEENAIKCINCFFEYSNHNNTSHKTKTISIKINGDEIIRTEIKKEN